MTTFDPAQHGWHRIVGTEPFMDLVGPVWGRGGGDPTLGYLVEPKHANSNGIGHGGMIMTFADQVLGHGISLVIGSTAIATVQLDVHLLSVTRVGDFVTCTPKVVRRTKSLCFASGICMVGDTSVAMATGILKIRGQ